MWKISVAYSVAPLLIGYLFYRKCGKCEKCRWLPQWLPCSLVLCFMGNVENVKNIAGSLGGSLAHWFSILWEMWIMWKMSVAPSVAPLLIGYLFYRKCEQCENCRWLPCSLVLCFMGNVKMWKISVAPSVAPLLIGYLFFRKCGKFEKYWLLPWWLSCSLAIRFIENVENVKNIGGSFGGFLAHCLSVL